MRTQGRFSSSHGVAIRREDLLNNRAIERHAKSRAIPTEELNATISYFETKRACLASSRMSDYGIRPSRNRAKYRSRGPSERGKRIERVRSTPRSRQPVWSL